MTKEEEFQKIADELDKIECPTFALWYLLPQFDKILNRQFQITRNDTTDYLASLKAAELRKAANEMREVISRDLW